MSWNLYFLPFQNLTALARIFPSVAWLKQVSSHPHSRKLTQQCHLWDLQMVTLCISHLQSETPKSSSSSRRYQQAVGYLTKGAVSYRSSLIAANKGKAYILRVVPKFPSSLICLGSFLSGMENRSDPLNGEEREGLRSTEGALRNYIIQRDVCYWKTKKGFGFLHFMHAWTQNLLPSHSLPFPAADNHAPEQGLQGLWSTSSSTKVSNTQLQLLRVEVVKNSDS